MDKVSGINICFYTTEYAHASLGRTGGIGVFVKKQAQSLANRNIDVTVFICRDFSAEFFDGKVKIVVAKDWRKGITGLREYYRKTGLPGYISFKLVLSFLNRLYASGKFSIFNRKQKFNILEFNDYGGHPAYFIGGTPRLIRCHGSALTLYKYFGYSRRAEDIPFEKLLFNRFGKNVIAVSNYSAEITRKAFKLKDKPTVIYNGIDLPAIDQGKNYFNKATLSKSIFYFGAIRERKGINIAAEVFNSIIEKHEDASFHILGADNNNYWDVVTTEILSDNAKSATSYYGNAPHNKINDYLAKANIVLFPSFGENFSIALLEAMALGKIVITSKIPSFLEIVDHKKNGFVAESKQDYVNLILKIFSNQFNLGSISKNARDTIKNRFSLSDTTDLNIKYYQKLIGSDE